MTATTKRTTLKTLLKYRHEGVLKRYCEEHKAPREEAEEVFGEMLKFLYLAHRARTDRRKDVVCAIFPEIEKIDWMWHDFILFTWDYTTFCKTHFGVYMHHTPSTDDAAPPADDVEEQVETMFGFIYDVLGEKTLRAWFEECRYMPA